MSPPTASSDIFLLKSKVPDLAHCVIKALPCEWKDCTVILNSRKTLLKHLQRHCHHVLPQDGVYHCLYLRCAGRTHSSTDALIVHAELSHVSRVPLSCPAYGCEKAFLRGSQLEDHFVDIHPNLLGQHVPIDSSLLTPRSELSLRPVCKPPLLKSPHTTSYAITPSVLTAHHSNSHAISGTETVSRKWSRLNVQDEECDKHDVVFEDLPHCQTSSFPPSPTEIKVQRRPSRGQTLLSRPQPTIYPPITNDDAPESMLYSTFLGKVKHPNGDVTS